MNKKFISGLVILFGLSSFFVSPAPVHAYVDSLGRVFYSKAEAKSYGKKVVVKKPVAKKVAVAKKPIVKKKSK